MGIREVTKRNGDAQPFDISKIKKTIRWACRDTELDPLELEQNILGAFRETETTADIQKKLIITASGLVDIKDIPSLKWNLVAGRLALMDLYKASATARGHDSLDYCPDFAGYLEDMADRGVYDQRLIDYYRREELETAGRMIRKEYDMEYRISALLGLSGRILAKVEGKAWELPQERNMVCALSLCMNEPPETRMELVEKTYKAIAERKISLATPMYAGLGMKGASLASCFIHQPEDSLDGIQYNEAMFGRISKNGGASGYSMHKIRGKHSPVAGYDNASGGAAPWEHILNAKCVAINQTGRRQGAITVAVPLYHRDIIEHLEIQEEAGDFRKKAYDISPQITIPDEFMRRVQAGEPWYLFCPYELKTKLGIELDEVFGDDFRDAYGKCIEAYKAGTLTNAEEVPSRFILGKIITAWHTTGYPTVAFSDTINKLNPNDHIGNIPCTNLCSESIGPVIPAQNFRWEYDGTTNEAVYRHDTGLAHVCNLMSINLYNASKELEEIIPLAVRALDNTIDLSIMQSPEAERYNRNLRTIGIGVLGFADWLAEKGISWHNAEAVNREADLLFAEISALTYKADISLARQKGAYPYYNGSKFSKGIILGKNADDMAGFLRKKAETDQRWARIASIWAGNYEEMALYGMRNASVLSIAPTGSSSLIQEASAGITPVFRKAYKDKNSITTCIVVAPEIEKGKPFAYQSQRDLNQAELYRFVGAVQKWIDQAISFELDWDQNQAIEAQDYADVLMAAWESGCKSIYYHRHITKTANSLAEGGRDDLCVGCSG